MLLGVGPLKEPMAVRVRVRKQPLYPINSPGSSRSCRFASCARASSRSRDSCAFLFCRRSPYAWLRVWGVGLRVQGLELRLSRFSFL
jgi:hypothetical protein